MSIVFFLSLTYCSDYVFFVANYGDNSISILHCEHVSTLFCGQGPRECVHVPPDKILVAECAQNSIGLIELKHKKYIESFPCGGEPRGLTYVPEMNKIFGVLKDQDKVFMFNPESPFVFSVSQTLAGPRRITFVRSNNEIWIACNTANKIAVHDAKTLKLLNVLESDAQPYALLELDDHIMVSSIGCNTVSFYSLKNYTAEQVHCGKHPTAFAHNDQNWFVTNLDTNQIQVFSKSDRVLLNEIDVGREPFDMCLTFDHIYVTCHGDSTVKMYRLSDFKLVYTFQVGVQPHGIIKVDNSFLEF